MFVNYVFFILCCPLLSASLAESSSCTEEDRKACTVDEFLESNFCVCSRCADICELRPDRSTDSSCEYNCPAFFKRRNLPKITLVGVKESGVGSTSVTHLPVQEDSALVKKPLFWTSVISVFISVVATIILVVLCTCKKSRSAVHRIRRTQHCQTAMLSKGANEKDESSTGMLRAAEDASDVRLSLVKNFSKEKCEETFAPLESHLPAMDSCEIVHETIISCYELSGLHKPCVASFRDSGFLDDGEKLRLVSMDDHNRTSTSASTIANSSMILATENAVACVDASKRTTDCSSESLFSSLCILGLETPSVAIERRASESGYFNSDSCTRTEDSLKGCAVYTVASGLATENEMEVSSSYPVQETRKDDGNRAADWRYYVEISPATFYGIESKAPSDRWSVDGGVKASLLTSLCSILDSTHDESASQESSEETGLKKLHPFANSTLNDVPEYACPTSHEGHSGDVYIHVKDQSIYELERLGDGKQLADLNLKIKSNADTPAAKSEPCVFKLEVRDFARHEGDNNEDDTALKMRIIGAYPKSIEPEALFDVNCSSCAFIE